MNDIHMTYLASPAWAERLQADLIPWIERVATLGDDVLEIGPGPGLTTDILRARAPRVTAIEVDPGLAAALAERLAGTNVEVLEVDAAALPLASDRFTSATCFSVLHHVPSVEHQDRVLRELLRVLQPGAGLFVTDARDVEFVRDAHADDVFVPLPPEQVVERFEQAGFEQVQFEVGDYEFRVAARKPGRDDGLRGGAD